MLGWNIKGKLFNWKGISKLSIAPNLNKIHHFLIKQIVHLTKPSGFKCPCKIQNRKPISPKNHLKTEILRCNPQHLSKTKQYSSFSPAKHAIWHLDKTSRIILSIQISWKRHFSSKVARYRLLRENNLLIWIWLKTSMKRLYRGSCQRWNIMRICLM